MNQNDQVQCSKCGGYKVQGGLSFHIEMAIMTVGIWGVILAELWLFRWLLQLLHILEPWDGSYAYACQICGYEWRWIPGTPPPPVTVQPDLISKGNRKLEEEERERRRRAND